MKEKYLFRKIILCAAAILFFADCRVPYDPPLRDTNKHNLVVEGFIDGASPTIIKLSRTRAVSDTAYPKPESNAQVFVEDDQQHSYPLYQSGSGTYTAGTLSLNPAYHYRLHIFTSDGKEYLSDFVPYKSSPAIDTIGWKFKDGGVQVYVNTHDPKNATTYYRWEYEETWTVYSYYDSYFKYIASSNTVVPRAEQVYQCWPSDNSTNILLASTTKLSSDIIYQNPLVFIEPHSEKLSVLYSIWVKQYALDTLGYNYWLAMKSNNENIGSIFDPQPNETAGNIHCVSNPAEKVVGYIGAGSSVAHRIFISNSAMPPGWNNPPYCEETFVPNIPDSLQYYFLDLGLDPIDYNLRTHIYSASSISCVDCTLKGTNIKPDFWP